MWVQDSYPCFLSIEFLSTVPTLHDVPDHVGFFVSVPHISHTAPRIKRGCWVQLNIYLKYIFRKISSSASVDFTGFRGLGVDNLSQVIHIFWDNLSQVIHTFWTIYRRSYIYSLYALYALNFVYNLRHFVQIIRLPASLRSRSRHLPSYSPRCVSSLCRMPALCQLLQVHAAVVFYRQHPHVQRIHRG